MLGLGLEGCAVHHRPPSETASWKHWNSLSFTPEGKVVTRVVSKHVNQHVWLI